MLYGKQTPKYCLRICRDGLFYVCAWSEGDDAPSTEELVTIDIKNLRMEINGSARSDFNAALEKAGYDYKNGSGSWGWKNNIDFGKDENGNTDYFSEIIKYNSLAVNRTVYKINRINNNPLHGMVCSDVKYAKAGNTVTADIMPDSGWYIKTAEVKTEAGESIPLISESGGSYTFTMPQSNVYMLILQNPLPLKAGTLYGALCLKNACGAKIQRRYRDGHGGTAPYVTLKAQQRQKLTRLYPITEPYFPAKALKMPLFLKAGVILIIHFWQTTECLKQLKNILRRNMIYA